MTGHTPRISCRGRGQTPTGCSRPGYPWAPRSAGRDRTGHLRGSSRWPSLAGRHPRAPLASVAGSVSGSGGQPNGPCGTPHGIAVRTGTVRPLLLRRAWSDTWPGCSCWSSAACAAHPLQSAQCRCGLPRGSPSSRCPPAGLGTGSRWPAATGATAGLTRGSHSR